MPTPYFPDKLDEQAEWYTNFDTEFPSRSVRLGFTAPDLTAIQNDIAAAVTALVQVRALAEDFSKTINGYVKAQLFGPNGAPAPTAPLMPVWPGDITAVLQGIDSRRQLWVQKLKASPNYDKTADGAALRTEPTGAPFDPLTYAGVIRSAAATGPATVRVVLGKANGAIDANKLRMRRKPALVWTDLGNFTKGEVFDRTPMLVAGQPEEREYQAQGVIGDEVIGLPSAIETVLVPA